MRAIAVLLIVMTGPVHAEPLDTAKAFDAYTRGKTLYFDRGDGRGVVAAESYLQDRQVRWSTRGGTCIEGEWYAEDGLICFTYEHNPDPQCWQVDLVDSGLVAVLANTPFPTRITESDSGDAPFYCLGPRIGV